MRWKKSFWDKFVLSGVAHDGRATQSKDRAARHQLLISKLRFDFALLVPIQQTNTAYSTSGAPFSSKNIFMKFLIKVPATSANLGPGFDALGLALDLWNETVISTDSFTDSRKKTDKVFVSVRGEGAGLLPGNEKNMLVRTAQKLAERLGQPLPPFQAECVNAIPMSSGLGSSSAAILTGLLAGNVLLGGPLGREELLNLAAELEGHPDNVAPAMLGGLVVAIIDGNKVVGRQIPLGGDFHVTVALPDFYLPTKQARAALPKRIPLKHAVYNLSRAALVTEAFRSGDLDLLGQVMDDRLHQPYRLRLIPGAIHAMQAAQAAGAQAVALSGAGPSLIAFASKAEAGIGESMKRAFEAEGLAARIFRLRPPGMGAGIQQL
jgi:homoserine kinase